MRYRLFTRGDPAVCATLLPGAFDVSERVRAALPSLWARLIASEQLVGGVIEDSDTSEPGSVMAFGMAVFLSDGFLDEYLRAPRPHLAAIVYEEIMAGRSPALELDAIRDANSGDGLNLLV